MKTIKMSPIQKKWVLTGSLLAVLGFNLSAPITGDFQTFELASEGDSKAATFITPDGQDEVEVTFIKKGDQTLAIVPSEFEGVACATNDCLTSQVLNVPYESEIQDLEKALRRQYASKVTPRGVGDLPSEEEAEASKEEYDEALLSKIFDKCERKDEGYERASCLTKDFLKAVKDKRKDIHEDVALDFFNDNIKPELVMALTSQRIESVALGGVALGQSAPRGADLLKKLQAELPSKYKDIRTAAKDTAVEVVNQYSAQAKELSASAAAKSDQAKSYGQQADQAMQLANQTQDPQQRLTLITQANQYRQLQNRLSQESFQLNTNASSSVKTLETFLVNGLGQTQYQGLQEAFRSKLVDQSFASSLMTSYQDLTAQALVNPVASDMSTINNNGPTLPNQGGMIKSGSGQGSITGGSLGLSPSSQSPAFIGSPRTADQGVFRQ